MGSLQSLLAFITRRRPQHSPGQPTTETHPPQAAASSTNMIHGRIVNIFGGIFILIGKPHNYLLHRALLDKVSSSTVAWPGDSGSGRREYSYDDWNSDKRYGPTWRRSWYLDRTPVSRSSANGEAQGLTEVSKNIHWPNQIPSSRWRHAQIRAEKSDVA